MKKLLLITIAFFSFIASEGYANNSVDGILSPDLSNSETVQRNSRTYYYLVWGSFTSLAEAKRYSQNLGPMFGRPVYKAKVNGQTVYRIAHKCKTLADAQYDKDLYGNKAGFDVWICKSKSPMQYVYCDPECIYYKNHNLR